VNEGDEHSHAILDRIRQELGKLPLSDQQKDSLIPVLMKQAAFLDTNGGERPAGNLRTSSSFFDFASKVQAVVAHFHSDGLTLPDYLRAAIKKPQLFNQNPETFIAHIEAVATHFQEHGLTTQAYIRAAVKQPELFILSPAGIIANIEGVVEHFRDYGLTQRDYLRAAVLSPTLFCQAPATISNNIETVATHFASDGLTLPEYLRAAVKRPGLFYQSPDTIIGHVNQIIDLHRQGLVHFRGEENAPPDQPLRPMFDFLINKPDFFTLAADNFTLREISAHVTGERPTSTGLLRRARYRVESELSEALGHADQRVPVPKEPSPQEGGDANRHARNLLLRALIREGIVKGTLER
jgi:hypothetical protein